MEAVYNDLFQSFSGQWQSQINPRASTSIGTIHQPSLSSWTRMVRSHTDQVTQWGPEVMFAGEQRDESWVGGTRCSWSALPFSRHSDAPRSWQAPSLQEGELPQCWLGEEIQVFALCPSRKQESLSLRLWEDFTFDSSWREIEKKTQPFLSQAGGCLHTQTGTVGYSTMVWVCPTSQPCQESLDPGGKEHIPGCEGLRGGQSTRCGWDRLLATPFGTAHDKVTLWPARRGCCLQSTFSV